VAIDLTGCDLDTVILVGSHLTLGHGHCRTVTRLTSG
jgi:hypothetical protein